MRLLTRLPRKIASIATAAAMAIAGMLATPAANAQEIGGLSSQAPTLDAVAQQFNTQVNNSINHANAQFNGAVNQANVRVNGAVNRANARVNGAINQANAQFNGAVDQANAQFNGAINQARAQVEGFANQANAQYANTVNQINNQINAAVGDFSSQIPNLSSGFKAPTAPAPAPKPAPKPAPAPQHRGVTPQPQRVNGIVDQTNAHRAAHGLAPVRNDAALNGVAQDWANHLAATEDLQHRPEHWNAYPSSTPAGGENVLQAWDDYSDVEVVQLFAGSPSHNEIMLDPRAKSVGVGVAVAPSGKLFVVQNFGR